MSSFESFSAGPAKQTPERRQPPQRPLRGPSSADAFAPDRAREERLPPVSTERPTRFQPPMPEAKSRLEEISDAWSARERTRREEQEYAVFLKEEEQREAKREQDREDAFARRVVEDEYANPANFNDPMRERAVAQRLTDTYMARDYPQAASENSEKQWPLRKRSQEKAASVRARIRESANGSEELSKSQTKRLLDVLNAFEDKDPAPSVTSNEGLFDTTDFQSADDLFAPEPVSASAGSRRRQADAFDAFANEERSPGRYAVKSPAFGREVINPLRPQAEALPRTPRYNRIFESASTSAPKEKDTFRQTQEDAFAAAEAAQAKQDSRYEANQAVIAHARAEVAQYFDEAIAGDKKAYRKLALALHPDRMEDLPPDLKAAAIRLGANLNAVISSMNAPKQAPPANETPLDREWRLYFEQEKMFDERRALDEAKEAFMGTMKAEPAAAEAKAPEAEPLPVTPKAETRPAPEPTARPEPASAPESRPRQEARTVSPDFADMAESINAQRENDDLLRENRDAEARGRQTVNMDAVPGREIADRDEQSARVLFESHKAVEKKIADKSAEFAKMYGVDLEKAALGILSFSEKLTMNARSAMRKISGDSSKSAGAFIESFNQLNNEEIELLGQLKIVEERAAKNRAAEAPVAQEAAHPLQQAIKNYENNGFSKEEARSMAYDLIYGDGQLRPLDQLPHEAARYTDENSEKWFKGLKPEDAKPKKKGWFSR